MRDFLGQELNVDDFVVLTYSTTNLFYLAQLTTINDDKELITVKWIWPEPRTTYNGPNQRKSIVRLNGGNQKPILKISEQQAVTFWLTAPSAEDKNESH